MTTSDRDHDLLIRMIETQSEMKAMLRSALERQDKTDEKVEAIGVRVSALEMSDAKQKGRMQLIGTLGGLAGGGIVSIAAAVFKDKLGF